MEHGKATKSHGWLTANGTKHIISKTNQSRKEDAYGAEQTRAVYHPPNRRHHLQGQSRVNESGGETMEDKILRIVRNDMVTNDGTYGIMETPQMSLQSERSAS